ncbi:MAG: hypothetical protein II662_00115, partial [Bacteroidales bacterium]|nr:hypothetical protein [Bacteroidales bacterium]
MKHFKQIALAIALVFATSVAWAQINLGDVPREIYFEDASIEHFGHLTMTVTDSVAFNTENRSYDTIKTITNIEWDTEEGTAERRYKAQQEAQGKYDPSGFIDQQSDWWYDMYWFRFYYPSINAKGERVVLSALAAFPDGDP